MNHHSFGHSVERSVCKHGTNPRFGLCSGCDHDRMYARQRKADRARFKAQLAAIRGPNWKPMS
jgi:hypothetical protein